MSDELLASSHPDGSPEPPAFTRVIDSQVLSIENWNVRFQQQARWTYAVRRSLYHRAGLAEARRVLEVGCGTGALTSELHSLTPALVFGLDANSQLLSLARQKDRESLFTRGDAHDLPYPDGFFDITYCHFFLLWVRDPGAVVSEMKRVTRPGGSVLFLAESDYAGRLDYPDDLSPLGDLLRDGLKMDGADPYIGRRLSALLAQAGLLTVEVGIGGGQCTGPSYPDEWESVWKVLEADLKLVASQDVLGALRARDAEALQQGQRFVFVPTFYAWGRVSRWG